MSAYDRIVSSLRERGVLTSAPPDPGPDLRGLTDDSREVGSGYLFCAVRGTVHDGSRFLADAVARGAAAVMVREPAPVDLPQLVVTDDRLATALAAAAWYEWPARRLWLGAVTGTNGKSTTVSLLRHLVNEAQDTGSIGTLGAFDGAGNALFREGLTTPGAVGLHHTLSAFVSRGTRRVVMEASSHALDQDRLAGLGFHAAVFTNLTHDHLDYHVTLGAYLRAKGRLVELLAPEGCLVVNADEPAWADLPPAAVPHRTVTFSVGGAADVTASEVVAGPTGTRFVMRLGGNPPIPVSLPLVGQFNVSNAVAAAAAAWGSGMAPDAVAARLESAEQIPGRMERLSDDPLVLRDYAHTPDALERALAAMRPLVANRLIVVFGCGGDRDRKKREPMGRIAVAKSDLAVVTSDNPRTEDPERILDDVVTGMNGTAYLRIADRREAIARALGLMQPGDGLLLAGKGHETYQVLGTERVPFDERAIVRELLESHP